MKMFPDGWYRKLSTTEMESARQQLKGYTLANQLEMGIKEVFFHSFFVGLLKKPMGVAGRRFERVLVTLKAGTADNLRSGRPRN